MENYSLEGKRVLFIGQKFYDYHEKIIAQLTDLGAEVVFYENKLFREDPVLYPKDFISKVKRVTNPNYKNKYINTILDETVNNTFDILFCIGGFSISNDFVNTLKNRNKGIKTIIYFWDSFNVWPFQHLIKSFDKVFSFEKSDCEKYELKYLPLFYSETAIGLDETKVKDIDVLYVGSVGPVSRNRFQILASLDELCKQNNLTSFLFLLYRQPHHNVLIKIINNIRRLVDSSYRLFVHELEKYKNNYNFIYNKPLNSLEIVSLFSKSNCVIDIPVPGQSGLTMRTIEALSMGCKLITTNPAIKEEPFYNSEWIYILGKDFRDLDLDFLKNRNKSKSNINIQHLLLKNWLKTIIDS